MSATADRTTHVIDVSRGLGSLPGEPGDAEVQRWLGEALDALGSGAAAVSVRIVGEEEMLALNASYRNNPRPTNVLSFPDNVRDEMERRLLGDIAVCSEVVRAESEQHSVPFRDRYAHMLVHGLLHLLGHDHAGDRERAKMESLERKLLARLGMGDPYEAVERGSAP